MLLLSSHSFDVPPALCWFSLFLLVSESSDSLSTFKWPFPSIVPLLIFFLSCCQIPITTFCFFKNNALTSPSSFFSSLSSSPFPVPSLFYLALLSLLSFGLGKLGCLSFLHFFSFLNFFFFTFLSFFLFLHFQFISLPLCLKKVCSWSHLHLSFLF